MRITSSAAALGAAVALVITGCSNGEDTPTEPETVTQVVEVEPGGTDEDTTSDDTDGGAQDAETDTDDTAATGETDGTSGTGDSSANGAALTGIDPANPPEPISEVTVPIGEGNHTSTTVELLKLERMDDTVVVAVMRLTPDTTSSGTLNVHDALGKASSPTLIDVENLKKYESVSDLGNNVIYTRADAGDPIYWWVAFPAPPSGATVHLQPSSRGPMFEGLTAP